MRHGKTLKSVRMLLASLCREIKKRFPSTMLVHILILSSDMKGADGHIYCPSVTVINSRPDINKLLFQPLVSVKEWLDRGQSRPQFGNHFSSCVSLSDPLVLHYLDAFVDLYMYFVFTSKHFYECCFKNRKSQCACCPGLVC